jgi:flagellar hook-associated protein FlgK
MSDLVSIAGGAVAAYQRALGTVSNNIANVDSEGYTRQDISLIENAPRAYGTSFLGTGVNIAGVRRLYDAFIENSLRNAGTELGTQGPIVNYANRVVDIVGNEDVGLLSAFDEFFNAARELATDASSVILRDQFLSKADGLAQRFQTLNSQLKLVEQETAEALQSKVGTLNTLAKQLELVNGQLAKTKLVERQPPALMDQRDLLLRKISELAKINVTESTNGMVTVSVGASASRGQIVTIAGSQPLSVVLNESDAGKADLVVNAGTSRAETVVGFSGGEISGYLNFRSQLLAPIGDSLDLLATTLVREANDIHGKGIDLQGRMGEALFRVEPAFRLTSPAGGTQVLANATLSDLDHYVPNLLRLDYRADAGQTSSIGLSGGYAVGDQISVTLNGQTKSFSLSGQLSNGTTRAAGASIDSDEVSLQLKAFLTGGNGQSVDGVFGRVLDADIGPAGDLLVTSPLFGVFNLEVSTNSLQGRLQQTDRRGAWTLTDTVTGQETRGLDTLSLNGITLELSGSARDGEILFLSMDNSAAGGIQLAVDDPVRVAAAARFRVIENQFNPGGADARLTEAPEVFPNEEALRLDVLLDDDGLERLDNNVLPEVAIALEGMRPEPVTIIPAGFKGVTLYLGDIGADPTDLQVLTRDGRHIAGREMGAVEIAAAELELGRPLTEEERADIVQQAGEQLMSNAKLAGVGLAEGASYSTQYLNAQDELAYRDLSVFYGVKASVVSYAQLTKDHVYGAVVQEPASVSGQKVNSFDVALGQVIFSEGDLVLNGISLGELSVTRRTIDPVTKLPLNPSSPPIYDLCSVRTEGLTAPESRILVGNIALNASNKFTINPAHLKLYLESAQSPGLTVSLVPLNTTRTELGFQLNRAISNVEGARVEDSEVRLGLGRDGLSTDLAKLGFRTGVYIQGEVPEDLLVFASSTSSVASFSLGATYTAGSRDPVEALRKEPFEVVFKENGRFQILDLNTDTVVADREYNPAVGISYRGVRLEFDQKPTEGDRFLVDGDQDGVGNNGNVLLMSDLQRKRVFGGGGDGLGLTLAEAYGKAVSDAGNIAFQASIAQKALEVVKDQAVQARDKISGVSLDEEAADLIRYQQAYQASAKVMQTASVLFDAILQVR